MSPSLYGTLLAVGEQRLETAHGEVTAHRFQNLLDRRPLIVLTTGDVGAAAPLLARIHSSCMTSETLDARDCDCAGQLSKAIAAITLAGRGAVFYLMQEGRGAGFATKARDRMLVQASRHRLTTFEAYQRMGLGRDLRRYDEVRLACHVLGIRAPLRLLTNNPEKLAAIRATGLPVAGMKPIPGSTSVFNLHYLDSKRRSGHALGCGKGGLREAELPELVESFEPGAAEGKPATIPLASYLLPVGADGEAVTWFRVHVDFDVAAPSERIVLTHGALDECAPLVGLHNETLLERFPLRVPGESRRRWRATVRAVAAHGAGCIVFRGAEEAHAGVGEVAARIAGHLPGRRVRTILDPSGHDPLGHALASRGFEIEDQLSLGEA